MAARGGSDGWKSGPYAALAFDDVRASGFVTSDAPAASPGPDRAGDAGRCHTEGMNSAGRRLLDRRSIEIGLGLIAVAVVLALTITFGLDPDDEWSPLHVVLVAAIALAGVVLCGWSRLRSRRSAGAGQ